MNMKTDLILNDTDKLSPRWIVKEIKLMLHGLGDCSQPLYTTALLIEEVMMKQLRSAVYQAVEVAALRGSPHVQAEDFIFLMRKDAVKVKRLLKYLSVKNMREKDQAKLDLTSVNNNSTDFLDQALKDLEPPTKRRKDCSAFLTSTNDTLLLGDDPFDAVKHDRLVRADKVTSAMDNAKYMEFCRSRRASFCTPSSKINALHDETLSTMRDLPEVPKLTRSARDILCYLAFETVAQIVDLAFLVRQDAAAQISDPFSRFTLASFVHPVTTSTSNGQIGAAPPLSPSEVREALRRYFTSRLNPYGSSSQQQKRLLAC